MHVTLHDKIQEVDKIPDYQRSPQTDGIHLVGSPESLGILVKSPIATKRTAVASLPWEERQNFNVYLCNKDGMKEVYRRMIECRTLNEGLDLVAEGVCSRCRILISADLEEMRGMGDVAVAIDMTRQPSRLAG